VAQISAQTPAAAFETLVANGWTFVTRDDNSGTHVRELAIWSQAGVAPVDDAYVATGQGMGFTLQVADQRNAFTLVEAGAYMAARDTLDLEPVPLTAHDDLLNPYSALLIDESGREFFDWLTSPAGVAALLAVNQELFGQVVYRPAGG
jgi:tungstate transport system substrate-binding protein